MKKMQCVTSFIDIGRSSWGGGYGRTNNKYFDNFISFYSNVKLDLILFCNDEIKEEISNRIGKFEGDFKAEINFQSIEKNDLSYFELRDKIDEIQKGQVMKDYSRRDHSSPPEYVNPDYVTLMFAKTEFIKISLDRGLVKEDNLAWIDFGIGHGHENYINAVKDKKLYNPNSEKIILFNRQNKELSSDPFFYSNLSDNVLVCGGFYVVPKNLIDFFYCGFKEIVNNFLDLNIVDDDQTILSIFASKNKEKCNIINSNKFFNNPPGGDWFPVFEYLK